MNVLILTAAEQEVGSNKRKLYVVREHITAMLPRSGDTTLFMSGGKHLFVKETPEQVIQKPSIQELQSPIGIG